jgi:hypothetical protein
VPQDAAQAAVWFARAAAQGVREAQSALEMSAPGRAEDPPIAAVPSGEEPDTREPDAERAWPPVRAPEPGTFQALASDADAAETWRTADALADVRREAEAGDALAQYLLARACATGDGVRADLPAALRWCSRAAEQGLPEAEYHLALCHAQGIGVAADQAEAASWFRRAAERGHAAAQFEMGVRYATGNGVPRDEREAADWYRRAAERGHAAAQFNLAVRFGQGRGVEASDGLAAWWYHRAAEQRHPAAQFNLGIRYAHGDGVPLDLVEAYWWVYLASVFAPGAQQARYADVLDELSAQMTPAQIEQRQERVKQWSDAFERRSRRSASGLEVSRRADVIE